MVLIRPCSQNSAFCRSRRMPQGPRFVSDLRHPSWIYLTSTKTQSHSSGMTKRRQLVAIRLTWSTKLTLATWCLQLPS